MDEISYNQYLSVVFRPVFRMNILRTLGGGEFIRTHEAHSVVNEIKNAEKPGFTRFYTALHPQHTAGSVFLDFHNVAIRLSAVLRAFLFSSLIVSFGSPPGIHAFPIAG